MKGGLKGIIIFLIIVIAIITGYSYANKINLLEAMSGGNPFDQSLNTTDDVNFNSVTTSELDLVTTMIGCEDCSLSMQGYDTFYWRGALMSDIVMEFHPDYNNGFARINKTLNVTDVINVPTLNVMNMTQNSTGFYWLQGTSCKMRQYYNGTHWVTTGVC